MRHDKGLSLIELMLTIAIATTALSAIIGYIANSTRSDLKNQSRSKLLYMAQEEMEKKLALAYDSSSLNCFGNNQGRVEFVDRGDYISKVSIVFLNPQTGTIPEPYPIENIDDTHLKQIIVSVVRKDGLTEQIDLINFKTP